MRFAILILAALFAAEKCQAQVCVNGQCYGGFCQAPAMMQAPQWQPLGMPRVMPTGGVTEYPPAGFSGSFSFSMPQQQYIQPQTYFQPQYTQPSYYTPQYQYAAPVFFDYPAFAPSYQPQYMPRREPVRIVIRQRFR